MTWYKRQLLRDGELSRLASCPNLYYAHKHAFDTAAPSTPGVGVLSLRARYSEAELEAVVEGYEELREHPNKGWIHVRLIDLSRAYHILAPEQRQAVLLCGIHGYSTRQAGKLLELSHSTVARRYAAGLDAMKSYLNGDYVREKRD
jgi:DNA-directed RNA polymerase specialized sigma24 family protein